MKTFKISKEQNAAIKRTDWLVVRYDEVISFYNSRAAAREAKQVLPDSKVLAVKDCHFEIQQATTHEVAPVPEIVKSAEALAEANAAPKAPKTPKIPLIRESTIERPCKQVWHIADAMKEQVGGDVKKMSRKAVLAKCVASGIAFYTARTQYQMWLTIQNGGTLK